MSNEKVHALFRDILAGVEPKSLPQMVGTDEKSTRILTEAAKILCMSVTSRKLLQSVYDLGRTDGGLQAVKAALKEEG